MYSKKGIITDDMTNSEKNYNFALELESKIYCELLNIANSATQKNFIKHIFDNNIYITPRQNENQIIHIDVSSQYTEEMMGISRKIANIRFDLKNAIITAIEFSLSTDSPESEFALLKLALLAFLKLYTLSTITLGNNECLLLLYLHRLNAYDQPVPEKKIHEAIQLGFLPINEIEYSIAIKKLVRLSSVVILAGEVTLSERIVLNYD